MSFLARQHLVIFGCGYVGTALAEAALDRGAQVTALTRNPRRAAGLRARGITVVEGELADAGWHQSIPPRADFVANTVSAADPTPEGYRRSYVEGMKSILAWAARGAEPVGTLVYTSSTGVYPQSGGAVVEETAPVGGTTPAARMLVEAEDLLRAAPASAVSRWFVLRLAGIYGPGRHHLLDALRAGTTRFSGSPEFRMNLAHRDDIVSAILAAFAAPEDVRNEIFNVSDDAPATRADLLGWLAAQLRVPAPTFSGVAGGTRRDGQPAPDRIIRAAKIRRRLGWAPAHADFRAGYGGILREV